MMKYTNCLVYFFIPYSVITLYSIDICIFSQCVKIAILHIILLDLYKFCCLCIV